MIIYYFTCHISLYLTSPATSHFTSLHLPHITLPHFTCHISLYLTSPVTSHFTSLHLSHLTSPYFTCHISLYLTSPVTPHFTSLHLSHPTSPHFTCHISLPLTSPATLHPTSLSMLYPGVGQAAGWIYPVAHLLKTEIMPVTVCSVPVKSVNSFFGSMCAPDGFARYYNPFGQLTAHGL